ncbi:Ig-like domain-containing protein [Nanoarchaeota archaeon]
MAKEITRILGLSMLILVVLSMSISGAAPLSSTNGTFFEGFESNSLATNEWTTSGAGAAWFVESSAVYPYSQSGSYYLTVEPKGESIVETNISTTGYENINISLGYYIQSLDGGEYLAADYYNGTSWTEIFSTNTYYEGWRIISSNLGSDVANNADFKIRVRCSADSNNEKCHIDNINVIGTEIIGDTTAPVINSISDFPDPINIGQKLMIGANVTDNVAVGSIRAEINNINYTIESAGSKHNILFDGLESGNILTNAWVNVGSNPSWIAIDWGSYQGTYALHTGGIGAETIVEKSISTARSQNISLSFYASTEGLDAGEYVAADWYNGTEWINLLPETEDVWPYTLYSYNLTSDADDNQNFKVRFRCYSSHTNEYCHADNINITGIKTELGDYNYDTTGLSAGVYPYTIYANDTSGNNAIPQTGNFTVQEANVTINSIVEDSTGAPLNTTLEIIDENNITAYNETKIFHSSGLAKGRYKVKVKPKNHTIKEARFDNITLSTDINNLIDLGQANETQDFLFSVNPRISGNTNITIIADGTALPNGTDGFRGLEKCVDWNFTTSTCSGTWTPIATLRSDGTYEFVINATDPGFKETVSNCSAEDSAAAGSWGQACDAPDGSYLELNDGVLETHTYTKTTSGGVRIQSVDSSITDCDAITQVELCYEWWYTRLGENCIVAVDADGGASYTDVINDILCDPGIIGTTPNPGIVCTDVTALETWTCANFFGSTGTRALAYSQLDREPAGADSVETVSWDVFYFNVTYTVIDNTAPVVNITHPTEGQNFTDIFNIDLNYTVIESYPDSCWYSLNNGPNTTLPSCANIKINVSPGANTVTVYANDTSDNQNQSTRSFNAIADSVLDVFDSKDPVEVLEEFELYANYTYTNGSAIAGATCSFTGNFGIFDDGRMIYFDETNGSEPNSTDAIFGNNSRRYDFINLLQGGIKYHPLIKYHKKGDPADNLYVYVRCDGNFTIDNTYLIGNVSAANSPSEPEWEFLIIDHDNITSDTCSIFVSSPNSIDYNNSYHILKSNLTKARRNNGTYYSDDYGQTWTESTYVDVVDFGHVWPGGNLAYNGTSGLYQSDYLMHVDATGTHNYNITCNKTYHVTQSQIESVTAQDNAAPMVQITKVNPNPAEYTIENVTIEWAAADFTLDTKKINVTYPNGTLLVESATSPLYLNISQLSVVGNYTIFAWANDSTGLTGNDTAILMVQDTIDPIVTITYPQNTNYSYNVSVINYTATNGGSGLDKCWYSTDGGATNSSSGACGNNFTSVPSIEGTNNWTVYANDSSGNTGFDSVVFIKDTLVPSISFEGPTPNSGITLGLDNFQVNVSASDTNFANITTFLYNTTGLISAATVQTTNQLSSFINLEDGLYFFNATAYDTFGNVNYTETRNVTIETITITFINAYGLNSSLGIVNEFNSSNLEEIEYMILNFSIETGGTISDWYLNYTADGSNGCALGNKQSSTCYNYDNSTYKWIQFINGTETTTYDGTQGNQGDRIIETVTGSGGQISISYKIDEHYNPNVFKWYDALYNFSDVKWQNGTDQRIGGSNLIKVELDQNIIPVDADQYKLDFRIQQNNPPYSLESYLCNSSYAFGHPHDFAGCAIVAQKMPSELQDVGTKFRAVFTKNSIDAIGDIKYAVFESEELNSSQFYAIKTYKARAANYTTHWDYSKIDELFFDGFESGSLATNNWTQNGSGAAWIAASWGAYQGTYQALDNPGNGLTSNLIVNISTEDYFDINLNFYWETTGFDGASEIYGVSYWNGTGWVTISSDLGDATGWTNYNTDLGADANNNSNLRLKFECSPDSNNERCGLENVQVNGTKWYNAEDGYETDLNINWFYNGIDPTMFVYDLWTNTTTGVYNSLGGNVTWNIFQENYVPIARLRNPEINEILNLPYNITFIASDSNYDAINVSLLLYFGGTFNKTIATNMNESNSDYYWNDSTQSGTYDLVLKVCELNTTELYCINDTRQIIVDVSVPEVFDLIPVAGTNYNSWTSIEISANVTDVSGVNLVSANITYPNGTTEHLDLGHSVVDKYNGTFTIPFLKGRYNITYYGEDITGRINNTETSFFNLIDQTPPIVTIIYPLGDSLDEDGDVAITVDLEDLTSIDTVLANVTLPDQTSTIVSGFSTGLPSDDFETDTEGVNWVHKNITTAGQTCFTDINNVVPGKMFIEVDGASIASGVQCAFNGLKRVDGDFDVNLTFNITYMEDDTFFTLRSAPTDSLSASGIRAYIVIGRVSGANEYRFGYNNGTGSTTVQTIPTTDTSGMLRIKRFNTTGTPIVNMYYMNNSNQEWINVHGNINLPGSSRAQFIQIKPSSSGGTYGKMNMTVDNFQISGDNYTFAIFNQTAQNGTYNVTIIANDTLGYVNNTEKTFFYISQVNDQPSRPYFDEPDAGDIITGLFNIEWGQVIDEDGDSLQFNITLLNPDGTDNATIVSDYGNYNTTSYLWNSSLYADGVYGMRITVFENETAERLSTPETLSGNFTIDNSAPEVTILYPLNHTIDINESVAIVLEVLDNTGVDTVLINVTLPNSTVYQISELVPELLSDNFDANTLGTNWEFRNDSVASGHSCYADINNTVPEKLFLQIDGSASSGSTLCGLSSIKRLGGDFDINISFNTTYMEDDTFFVFRVNNEKELFSAGTRLFISLRQTGGERQYRFGIIDGGINLTAVDTNDTYGKLRIKKSNSSTGAIFDAYYFNNSNQEWVQEVFSYPLNESSRTQFVHVYLESSETNLGRLNVSVDDFSFSEEGHGDHFIALFNYTSQEGEYNVSVFVNDTQGNVNNTETTNFHIVNLNDPPSPPIITTPSPAEIVKGLINITWGIIVDPEGDSLQFNITLLNPDGTDNATIVSNYGDASTLRYEWDTSAYQDGIYNVEVLVYENETVEKYSRSGTLTGNFTIDNSPPTVFDLIPSSGTNYSISQLIQISANVTDLTTVDLVTANITYPNTTIQKLTLTNAVGDKYNNSFTIPIQIGQYNVIFFANDSVNNINSTETTFFVGNDVTPPGIAFENPTPVNNSYLPQDYVEINVSALDAIGADIITIKVYNSTSDLINITSSGTSPFFVNITSLSEGTYYFNASVNDTSDNTNYTETRTLVLDTKEPSIIIYSPQSTTYGSATVLVNLSATDINPDSVWYNWNGTNMPYSSAHAVTFDEGSNTLIAYANDSAGNLNSTNVTFIVDTTEPNITQITDYNEAGVTDGIVERGDNVTFNVTVTDSSSVDNVWIKIWEGLVDVSNVIYQGFLNFIAGELWSLTVETNESFPTGDVSYTIYANDTLGNQVNQSSNFTVQDTTKPVISFVAPTTSAGAHNQNEILANATSDSVDLDTITINLFNSTSNLINSTSLAASNLLVNFSNLAEGSYYLNATANDTAGNLNYTETRNIILDNTYPSITFENPTPSSGTVQNISSLLINVSASDTNFANITTYLYNETTQISKATVSNTVQFSNFVGLPNGIYYFNATAYDDAGNVNYTETRNVTINRSINAPPYWSNLNEMPGDPADYVPDKTYYFNITWNDDEGVDSVWIEFDGVNYTSEVYNISNTYVFNRTGLSVGVHNYTWYANDTNKNLTSANETYTLNALPSYSSNGSVVDEQGTVQNASYKIYNSTGHLVYSSDMYYTFTFEGTQKYDLLVTAHYDDYIRQYELKGIFNNTNNTNPIQARFNNITNHHVVNPTTLNFDELTIELRPATTNGIFFKCSGTYNLTTSICSGTWEPWLNVKSIDYENYTFTPGDPALSEANGTFFEDWETGSFATNNWTNDGCWAIVNDAANAYSGDYYAACTVSGTYTLYVNVSTAGYENINISFWYQSDGYYVTSFAADYWNGTTWRNLFTDAPVDNIATWTNVFNTTESDADDNADLRLRFVRNGGNNRDIWLENIFVTGTEIDYISPSVSTIQPTSANEDVATNYNATVSDNVGVTACNLFIDGALNGSMDVSGTLANRSVTITTPGSYQFLANCTDAAGNYNDTSVTNVTINDVTAPTWNETPTNRLLELGAPLYYDVNASDNVAVDVYSINDNTNFTINPTNGIIQNNTGLSIGTYSLNISVNDTSNNVLSEVINVTVQDTTKPSVSTIEPTNVNEDVSTTYNATVYDLDGVTSCNLYIDGTLNGSMSITGGVLAERTVTVTTPGSYQFLANCTDATGNYNDTSTTTVTINDITAPTWDETPQNQIVGHETDFSYDVNASDNVAIDTYSVDNSNFSISGAGVITNTTLLSVGVHSLNISVNDTSNNKLSEVITVTVQDTTKPSVSTIEPTNVNEDVSTTYNATVYDLDGVTTCNLFIDGTLNGSMSITGGVLAERTLTVTTPGSYQFLANCTDATGNYNDTSTTTVTINDITAPTWDETPQNQIAEYGTDFSYDVNASDNVAIDTYSVDNSNFSISGAGVITNTTLLSVGVHSLNISVNDTSNNKLSEVITVTVNDTIAPVISSVTTGTITNETGQILWSTNENANSTVDYGLTTALGSSTGSGTLVTAHDLTILSLTNNTLYYYNVTSCDVYGYCSIAGPYNFTTISNIPDTSAPIIANVNHSGVTNDSAIINWTTDDTSNSTVYYGETIALGSSTSSGTLVTTHSITLTGLTNVTLYYYNVSSCNQYGNCSTDGYYNFTTEQSPDVLSPSVSTIQPTSADEDTSTTYNATLSDVEGVTSCNLFIDGTLNGSMTISGGVLAERTLTLTTPGSYQFLANCSDAAGNYNDTSTTTVTINDITTPSLVVSSPVDGNGYTVNNISIYYTVLDNVGVDSCWYTNTTGQIVNLVGCANTSINVTDGDWNITVYANDTSNNINSSQISFLVDTANPVVNFVYPTPGDGTGVSATTITVNVTAANGPASIDSCKLTFNNTDYLMTKIGTGSAVSCNFTLSGLSEGFYVYNVTANDTLNNIGYSANRNVTIDITTPEVSTIEPVNVDEDVTTNYNATVSDNLGITSCNLFIDGTLNGSMTVAGGLAERTLNVTTPGSYQFLANCTDIAGNYNDTSTTTVTINDITAPVMSSISESSITTSSAHITWTIDELANSTVEYGLTSGLGSIESSPTLTTSHDLTLTNLTNGTVYYYNVTSCDADGNCDTLGLYNFTTANPTPPSTGGGGSHERICNENWNCTEWNECSVNGLRTRACTELSGCGTYLYRPIMFEYCEPEEIPSGEIVPTVPEEEISEEVPVVEVPAPRPIKKIITWSLLFLVLATLITYGAIRRQAIYAGTEAVIEELKGLGRLYGAGRKKRKEEEVVKVVQRRDIFKEGIKSRAQKTKEFVIHTEQSAVKILRDYLRGIEHAAYTVGSWWGAAKVKERELAKILKAKARRTGRVIEKDAEKIIEKEHEFASDIRNKVKGEIKVIIGIYNKDKAKAVKAAHDLKISTRRKARHAGREVSGFVESIKDKFITEEHELATKTRKTIGHMGFALERAEEKIYERVAENVLGVMHSLVLASRRAGHKLEVAKLREEEFVKNTRHEISGEIKHIKSILRKGVTEAENEWELTKKREHEFVLASRRFIKGQLKHAASAIEKGKDSANQRRKKIIGDLKNQFMITGEAIRDREHDVVKRIRAEVRHDKHELQKRKDAIANRAHEVAKGIRYSEHELVNNLKAKGRGIKHQFLKTGEAIRETEHEIAKRTRAEIRHEKHELHKSKDAISSRAHEIVQGIKNRKHEIAEGVRAEIRHEQHKLQERRDAVKDRAHEVAEGIRDERHEIAKGIKAEIRHEKHELEKKKNAVKDRVNAVIKRIKDRKHEIAEGVGAEIGHEQHKLQERRDAVKDRAHEIVQGVKDERHEIAKGIKEEIRHEKHELQKRKDAIAGRAHEIVQGVKYEQHELAKRTRAEIRHEKHELEKRKNAIQDNIQNVKSVAKKDTELVKASGAAAKESAKLFGSVISTIASDISGIFTKKTRTKNQKEYLLKKLKGAYKI